HGLRHVGVGVPVEHPDLVRAVVRAVPGADAAVVDLPVHAVGRVVRGEDRADRLAGRVATVLAHHREVTDVDRTGVTRVDRLVVALDPDPGEIATHGHLILAHPGHV